VDQVTVADQGTQALIRPPRSVAFTQTATAPRSTTTSWTQVPRTVMIDCGTDMPPALTTTIGCQAGAYFNNDIIPPGAPRLKLPWAYSYAKFDQLLQAYPEVHPEDFVTFGILQEQPRRGSYREWGEVAGVLSHMVGGRRLLVTELMTIVNKIQRLQHGDRMRDIEEQALLAVLLRERRRSGVCLGEGAFSQLVAPGEPLNRPQQPGPSGAPRDPRRRPQPSSASAGTPGPSGAQGGPGRP